MNFNLVDECWEQDHLDPYHGILLVEANPGSGGSFFDALNQAGFDVLRHTDIRLAVECWVRQSGLIAVLDEELLYENGVFFADILQEACPGRRFPYVVLSQEPDYKQAVSYLKEGAMDYLVKDPALVDYLPRLLRNLMERLNSDLELQRSQRTLLEHELELRVITENIEDVLIKTDQDGICTYVSSAVNKVLKMPASRLVGRSVLDRIHVADTAQVEARLQEIVATGMTGKFEFRMRQDQGGYVWVEAYGTPMFHGDQYSGTILTLRDITHRRMIDKQLAEERDFSKTILETVGSLIVVLSRTGQIVRLNRACAELTGLSLDDADQAPFWSLMVDENEQALFMNSMVQVLQSRSSVEFECRMTPAEGGVCTIQWVLSRLKGDSSCREYVVCTGLDITNRKIIEEEIRYMSFHDSLTGLYNRAFFEEELARLNSGRHLPLSIIIGDVNGLKLINDAFGHATGDRLIQAAASAIRGTCRADDITARIGGDEFGILLPETEEKAALEIASRIRAACKAMAHDPIGVSMAVGVATKSSDEEDVRLIFKLADDRMYKSKLVESKSLKSAIITSLKKTLHERTNDMGEHSERLKELALRLGQRLGFTPSQQDDLELLALLHDIGKIAVPDGILNKPAPLTDEEWEIMRQHPEVGYRIASTTPELSNIAELILSHHEWMDGTGYPQGLHGESIPVISRALSVVDAYDAMISTRKYRRPRSPQEALMELEHFAGRQFDRDIVREFIRMILEEGLEAQIV